MRKLGDNELFKLESGNGSWYCTNCKADCGLFSVAVLKDQCDNCEIWVNNGCSFITESQYETLQNTNCTFFNGIVSTKIYDKRDDFDIETVNFLFLDGDVPRRILYGVYISQHIRFARASSNVSDFSCRNKALTAKLFKQGYRYHKLRKAFSKFYRRHSELVEKYNVSLRKLLQQGISEPEFYGDFN